MALLHAREALWLDLGTIGFAAAHRLQLEAVVRRRAGETPDIVMVAEHDPCITLGRSAKREHVLSGAADLAAEGIEIYDADRGGDVTYHGPGQLVCYPIVDLTGFGRDVHAHARRLEEIMIRTAAAFRVCAHRDPAYPGVWCSGGKLGAIGFGVRGWVTIHGASLNVSPHMPHYDLLVPCGIRGRSVTSLERAGGQAVCLERARSKLRRACGEVFGMSLSDTSDAVLSGIREERGVLAWR